MNRDEYAARLKSAEWLQRDETRTLLSALDGAKGRTRAVGGVVRDTLLDRPRDRTDIDFATELKPHEVSLRAENAGASVHPTGIEHGTVTLRLGELVAEVTTLREDVDTDGRRALVRFGKDWTRDAERRDFTLNALYASMDGELLDPLDGLDDCIAGRVRFIGDPMKRIEEDRLRVLRFFRFSASHSGEKFDAAGLEACRQWSGRLDTVSAERIGSEFRRMMALPRVAVTFKTMAEVGLLTLSAETIRLLHSYERRARRPDLAARLALIIAETGASQLQALWRLSRDDIAAAEAILTVAELIRDFRLNEAAYRHPAALVDGIEVAAAIAGWTDAGKLAVTEELRSLDVPRFPLDGNDLIRLGMRPGKALGAELDRLEQRWIESGFTLDRDELLSEVRRG